MSAWGGISTLGLGLGVLYTEGQRDERNNCQIVDWLSVRTALHAGCTTERVSWPSVMMRYCGV